MIVLKGENPRVPGDGESAFAPWSLIAAAYRDALHMWRRAWFAIVVYAALQSIGFGCGYIVLTRVSGAHASPGITPLLIVGALICAIAGGWLGAPLARYASLTLLLPRSDDDHGFALLHHYRDVGPVYRSLIASFAALSIGLLAIAFIATLLGAILFAAVGIIGAVITAITALIVIPAAGALFMPFAHVLWSMLCLSPGDPKRDFLTLRMAFGLRRVRDDAIIWGAAMLFISAASLSLGSLLVAAAALNGGFLAGLCLGTLVTALFMSMQWSLALRFYHALHAASPRFFMPRPLPYIE